MENDKSDKAHEPLSDYGFKRLTFFNSYVEEADAQVSYWRGLSHIERMEQLRIVSKAAFSHFPKYTGNRLKFD